MTLYLALILATFLLGLSKGGFSGLGMAAMPVVTLVAPPVQAAAILLPIIMLQDLISLAAYRGRWDGRNLACLLPGASVGIGLGYLFAAEVSQQAVLLSVGVISVAFGLSRLVMVRGVSAARPRDPEPFRGFLCGAASGFTSMITHAGGPPFQIFVMPQRLSRDVFVGTSVAYFAVVNLIKVPPFIALGQLDWQTLAISARLAPVALASSWLGLVLVRRTSPERFFGIVNWLLVILGLKLIYDGVF